MRNAFIKALGEQAKRNKNIYLATGDLGYSAFEPFIKENPRQYINVGVAEQNLIGVSAGLAMTNKIVYAYSIATFASMRAVEQIRNDICYQNLSVRIIGVGGGFSYGTYGATHYAIEDLALMRSLPNMTVIAPSDPAMVETVIAYSVRHKGPMYIRLGKAGEPRLHKDPKFILERGYLMKQGEDGTIMVTGAMLGTALEAARILDADGFSCRVIDMPTVKPVDSKIIQKAAVETGLVVTLEEHTILGGLGSAVAEVLAESALRVRFERIQV